MKSRPLSRWMTLAAMVAVSGCAVAASSGVRAQPVAVISQASNTFSTTNSRHMPPSVVQGAAASHSSRWTRAELADLVSAPHLLARTRAVPLAA